MKNILLTQFQKIFNEKCLICYEDLKYQCIVSDYKNDKNINCKIELKDDKLLIIKPNNKLFISYDLKDGKGLNFFKRNKYEATISFECENYRNHQANYVCFDQSIIVLQLNDILNISQFERFYFFIRNNIYLKSSYNYKSKKFNLDVDNQNYKFTMKDFSQENLFKKVDMIGLFK